MWIELNSNLQYIPDGYSRTQQKSKQLEEDIKSFVIELSGKQHSQPITVIKSLSDWNFTVKRGLLDIISSAYDRHLKLTINPHDLWYIVLTQISEEINKNSNDYRKLFTLSSDIKKIIVPQDHPTEINVDILIETLKEHHIPGGNLLVELFLPELSTLTKSSKLAMSSAFLSCVRKYYSYGMFLCGIPAIDLRGNIDDWNKLVTNLKELRKVFTNYDRMQEYLTRILNIFEEILNSFDKVDTNFWKNIYTHNNVGSGGDLEVTGWIKKLYFKQDQKLIKSFHDCMSGFEYEKMNTCERFVMVHGAFGASIVNETVNAEYDYLIYQIK